jgi:hypothetical protein
MTTAMARSAQSEEDRVARDGRFSFSIADCAPPYEAEVRRILGIEIGDLLLPQTDGGSADAPADSDRLTVQCTGHFARIQAEGQANSAPFEQVLNLEDFPGDAAPRALALAGLELLASLNGPVRARIGVKAPAPPAPPAPPALPAPLEPSYDLRVGVAGVGRAFLSNQGARLWGGRVDALLVANQRWALTMDIDLERGQKSVATLGEATAWLCSAALGFGVHGRTGILDGMAVLGGRLGGARLAGTSSQPATVASNMTHPWGGPLAMLGGAARFGRISLGLQAEVGWTILASQGAADGGTILATKGPWLALVLDAGFHL